MANAKLKEVSKLSHADALTLALNDLSFDGRAAFIGCGEAAMLATDVDKILGAVDWTVKNRHIKAEASRIWKAGGAVTRDADKYAKDYAEKNELMKGNWKQLSNRVLDGVITGLAFDAAKIQAEALTKAATLAELATKGFTKGAQLMRDSFKDHPNLKDKAAKSKAAGLLEQLEKLVG